MHCSLRRVRRGDPLFDVTHCSDRRPLCGLGIFFQTKLRGVYHGVRVAVEEKGGGVSILPATFRLQDPVRRGSVPPVGPPEELAKVFFTHLPSRRFGLRQNFWEPKYLQFRFPTDYLYRVISPI